MPSNTEPIYSKVGAIGYGPVFTTAANDYTGATLAGNAIVFQSDNTNGSFLQKLRFKAIGTNTASVARVFINNGNSRLNTLLSAPAGTPTGTPSASGGTLMSQNLFAKVYTVDQWGSISAASTETASVTVTGPTASVTWNWTAATGAASYIITVGAATGAQIVSFTSTTNSYVQTSAGSPGGVKNIGINNYFFGEISLPGTTATIIAATIEVDYPMNIALPPGYNVIVGLGTTVAAGWVCTAIAGNY